MEVITRKEAVALGLKRYFTGEECRNGHLSERDIGGKCIECKKEYYQNNKEKIKEASRNRHWLKRDEVLEKSREYYRNNKEKFIQYRIDNADRIKESLNREKANERQKRYRERNKERVAKTSKARYEKNKEKQLEQNKKWMNDNKEKRKEYMRRYREDNRDAILSQMSEYRRNNSEALFIRKSLGRIEGNWRGGRKSMEKLHGYTFEELRQHLESQFQDGMSWDNRSEWHIDHIKPISAFIKEGITDPKIINALDNLQPLWAFDNISKGAKY